MLRLTWKLPANEQTATPEGLRAAVAEKLGIRASAFTLTPRRRSVDARGGAPAFLWAADLSLQDEKSERALRRQFPKLLTDAPAETPYRFPTLQTTLPSRPIVVGFGPSGLFCALMLARCGFRPIVLERGGCMEERVQAVESFFRGGELDKNCNVQYGEGGAGTFSDGKLNTLSKDRSFRGFFVLEQFVRAGAPAELLWQSKPHIGTDLLRQVIVRMRTELEELGGEVRFHQTVVDLLTDGGHVCGVKTADGNCLRSETVVLALGHSARDTLRMLHARGVPLQKKPFSVGVRIEHPQEDIDRAQYHLPDGAARGALPPADYKLVCHTRSGRTVYSFCMCPGGTVVAAASDEDGVVTNGMSFHTRDGAHANSALLCEVLPEDLSDDLFAGVELQRELEKAAFRAGGGGHRAPAQTVGDFLADRPCHSFGEVKPTYPRGVTPSDLRKVLPAFVTDALADALPFFGRQIAGFDRADAVMTAVESRSTSPLRILRGENMQSPITGLYPIGEGAGYAGGIITAAIDGIKCAEQIVLGAKSTSN